MNWRCRIRINGQREAPVHLRNHPIRLCVDHVGIETELELECRGAGRNAESMISIVFLVVFTKGLPLSEGARSRRLGFFG